MHRLTPIPGLQGDFGWLDIRSRWILEAIRMYNRFLKMKDERINKKVFLWDKLLCDNNWSSSFRNILVDLNLNNHWDNNASISLEVAKSKVIARCERDWKHHCLTKPKLRTYRSFKTDMKVATYLKCNLPKFQRSLISQLRFGILPIRIETGRFVGLDENEQICEMCNQNEIEEEAHLLFSCDLYAPFRLDLETGIGVSFRNIPNITEKFKVVFDHPYCLGKYLNRAIHKRREMLYKS